jgi:hypothetical protein
MTSRSTLFNKFFAMCYPITRRIRPYPRVPHSLRPRINYFFFNAQVRVASDKPTATWLLVDPILRDGASAPELWVGDSISLVDVERFDKTSLIVTRKGTLKKVHAYEKGYIIFILETDDHQLLDIFGSHHQYSKVAIPIDLLRLGQIHRICLRLIFCCLKQTLGQIVDSPNDIRPPHRAFSKSSAVPIQRKTRAL